MKQDAKKEDISMAYQNPTTTYDEERQKKIQEGGGTVIERRQPTK